MARATHGMEMSSGKTTRQSPACLPPSCIRRANACSRAASASRKRAGRWSRRERTSRHAICDDDSMAPISGAPETMASVVLPRPVRSRDSSRAVATPAAIDTRTRARHRSHDINARARRTPGAHSLYLVAGPARTERPPDVDAAHGHGTAIENELDRLAFLRQRRCTGDPWSIHALFPCCGTRDGKTPKALIDPVRRRMLHRGDGYLCSESHTRPAANSNPGVHSVCMSMESSHPLQGRLLRHLTRPRPGHPSSRLDNDPSVLLY